MFRLLFSCLLVLSSLSAKEFKILTEEYAPFNYTKNAKVTGLATEVVAEVAHRMDHSFYPEVMPWARAYLIAQTKPNIILYSTTRIPDRENLFKWVGPIIATQLSFFVRKDSSLTIQHLEDAKSLGSIGVYRDDVAEMLLKSLGFNNLDSVTDDTLNAKKLVKGRLDAWFTGNAQGYYRASEAGVVTQIKDIYQYPEALEMYMAFSKDTPDSVIQLWQEALDGMKRDGSYRAIQKKYIVE